MLDYAFLADLVGTPYGDPTAPWFNVESPYWTSDSPLLPAEVIREQGCTSSGLGNLARRTAGVPALGQMSSWWGAFALFGETTDPSVDYPMGTLFLRSYRGPTDHGDLAILTPDGLLQSRPEEGVCCENVEVSLWDLAVLPRYWLTSAV